MAKHNLEQEQLISEVKNHIAIVRSAHIYRKQVKFVYPKKASFPVTVLIPYLMSGVTTYVGCKASLCIYIAYAL